MDTGKANAETPASEPAEAGPVLRLPDDNRALDRICDAASRHFKECQEQTEQLVDEYRYGYHGGPDKGKDSKTEKPTGNERVQANLTFSHVNVQRAELYTYEPGIEVDPRDMAGAADDSFSVLVRLGVFASIDEAKRAYADAMEDMLKHTYHRGSTQEENEAAVFDAQTRGLGITKESFDPLRGMDRSDRLWRHEVYFDPHARHSMRQCGYVIHTCTKPIWEARDFFDAQGITKINPNYAMRDSKGLDGRGHCSPEDDSDKDLYRFHEMWLRDSDKRWLIYKDAITKKTLLKRPWPFELEIDDFPFSTLAFNRQYVNLRDSFSELEVIATLRRAYDRLVRFLDEQTHRSIAKKILVDAGIDPQVLEKIKNSKTMEIIECKTLGKGLANVVQVLDLNTPNDVTAQTAVFLKQLADEITGLDEIIRGASARDDVTATEADIRENNAQRRSAVRAIMLDRFLITQCRHRAQIGRQLITPDLVRKVAGDKAALLWSLEASSAEDFVAQYTVGIAAGSTGQRARREKLDRMERLRQAGHQENQALIGTGRPPAVDTLQIMREQAREDNIRNVDRFMLPGAQAPMAVPGVPPGPFPPGAPGAAPQLAGPGAVPAPGAPAAPPAPAPNPATPTTPTGVPMMGAMGPRPAA